MTAPILSPRCLVRAAGMLACAFAVVALLAPPPAEAANGGAGLRKSPGTSLNQGTCRPKWPYIVLSCVA